MYWSVLGCICAVESVAEWLISWCDSNQLSNEYSNVDFVRIPFYYLVKTIFLLYLSLPQIRGSTYIYLNHLQPFLHSHEQEIDATLASLKARVYIFLQDRVRQLWEHISQSLSQHPAIHSMPAAVPPPPPTQGWSPAQLAALLWNSYGPTAVASASSFFSQSSTTVSPTASSETNAQSIIQRRRQLEAELASLAQVDMPSFVPMPKASPSVTPPSEGDIRFRDRTASVSGKFEEIEMLEGYDVEPNEESGNSHQPTRSTSWFGWGSSPKGGYERIKSD